MVNEHPQQQPEGGTMPTGWIGEGRMSSSPGDVENLSSARSPPSIKSSTQVPSSGGQKRRRSVSSSVSSSDRVKLSVLDDNESIFGPSSSSRGGVGTTLQNLLYTGNNASVFDFHYMVRTRMVTEDWSTSTAKSSLSSRPRLATRPVGSSPTTSGYLDEIRALKLKRDSEISFFRSPLRTLRLCLMLLGDMRHRAMWYCVSLARVSVPLGVLVLMSFFISNEIFGPSVLAILREFRIWFLSLLWWTILGILSSIGLGSGMHSGILFLVPHCCFIVSASEKCNSLNFDPRTNMWSNRLGPGGNGFECLDPVPPSSNEFESNVTVLGLTLKMLPYAFFWGFGTALGELPPYAASFASSVHHHVKHDHVEHEDEHGTIEDSLIMSSDQMMLPDFVIADCSDEKSIVGSWMTRMKRAVFFKMADLINNYGSLSVFLLSSWPNALFDLCGIICGFNGMPFWSFFIPLVLGKAVVKILVQTWLIIFILSKKFEKTRAKMVPWIVRTPPFSQLIRLKYDDPDKVEAYIVDLMMSLRGSLSDRLGHLNSTTLPASQPSDSQKSTWVIVWNTLCSMITFKTMFSFIISLVFLHFTISAMDHCARMKQKELDEQYIRQKWNLKNTAVVTSTTTTTAGPPSECTTLNNNDSSSSSSLSTSFIKEL